MRIVFFCRLFYPHIGGVETHVMEISQRLVSMGHEVCVIAEDTNETDTTVLLRKGLPQFSRNPATVQEVNGIKIYKFSVGRDGWSKKFRIWSWLLRNKYLITTADIVHCHDVFFWYLPFRFLYQRKPVFTTFHGYEGYPISQKAIIIRKISEKLSRANICIGKFITKWYGTKATVITYGAAQMRQERADNEQKHTKKIKIVFIGRLESVNGIQLYIDTLKILRQKNSKFDFVAYGDGSLRTELEKFGEVKGFVRNVVDEVENADIIFASSYLSILQAFAARKLVFAVYDNPLKRDYLQMTPFARWMYISDNPEVLAERILYYQTHQQAAQALTKKAYAWAKEQTWEKLTEIYMELWRNTCL